jgi:hypothetical protein
VLEKLQAAGVVNAVGDVLDSNVTHADSHDSALSDVDKNAEESPMPAPAAESPVPAMDAHNSHKSGKSHKSLKKAAKANKPYEGEKIETEGQAVREPCDLYAKGMCYRGRLCPFLHGSVAPIDKYRPAVKAMEENMMEKPQILGKEKPMMEDGAVPPTDATSGMDKLLQCQPCERQPCDLYPIGCCYRGPKCPYLHGDKAPVDIAADAAAKAAAMVAAAMVTEQKSGLMKTAGKNNQTPVVMGQAPPSADGKADGAAPDTAPALEPPPVREPCDLYITGVCYRGRKCPFLHGDKAPIDMFKKMGSNPKTGMTVAMSAKTKGDPNTIVPMMLGKGECDDMEARKSPNSGMEPESEPITAAM